MLLGLRADFYRQAIGYPVLRQALDHHQVVLAPMGEEQLRRVIVEPALRAHCTLDDALVDVLLAETPAEAGAPPLLSHVLDAMWQSAHRLTMAEYRDSGPPARRGRRERRDRLRAAVTAPGAEADAAVASRGVGGPCPPDERQARRVREARRYSRPRWTSSYTAAPR